MLNWTQKTRCVRAHLSVQVLQVHPAGSAESFQQQTEASGNRLVMHL